MKNKEELIKLFKESCNIIWEVDVNNPFFEGVSPIDGIKEWDRNVLDVFIKNVIIRVFKEDDKFYIVDLKLGYNSKYEINENEFLILQKKYFREHL